MLTVVDAAGTTPNGFLIDEIVREGARRMLAAALEAEVNGYLADLADQRDERGRRLVVRNGFHAERTIATSAGPVQVKAPRVNDRRIDAETGERKRFSRRSCRRGPARPRRYRRYCRCCTCTACPPATSSRHWNSSSARPPGYRRRPCRG